MNTTRTFRLAPAALAALGAALASFACVPLSSTCDGCVAPPVVRERVAVPMLLGTDPASPATALSLRVLVASDPDTTVSLFANAACVGPPVASGGVGLSGRTSFPVAVQPLSLTFFYAQARAPSGDLSPCSQPITYQHVETPPTTSSVPLPIIDRVLPIGSLGAGCTLIDGTAPAGSTVRFLGAASCVGPVRGEALAGPRGRFRAQVCVPAGESFVWPQTIDANGERSVCGAAIRVRRVGGAPVSPVLLDGENQNGCFFLDGAAEPSSSVFVYSGTECGGTALATATTSETGHFRFYWCGSNGSAGALSLGTVLAGATTCAPEVWLYDPEEETLDVEDADDADAVLDSQEPTQPPAEPTAPPPIGGAVIVPSPVQPDGRVDTYPVPTEPSPPVAPTPDTGPSDMGSVDLSPTDTGAGSTDSGTTGSGGTDSGGSSGGTDSSGSSSDDDDDWGWDPGSDSGSDDDW